MRITVLAVLSVLMLAGCDETGRLDEKPVSNTEQAERAARDWPESQGEDVVFVREVRLPEGRTVLCVVWDGYKAGGIDCDWNGHRGGP